PDRRPRADAYADRALRRGEREPRRTCYDLDALLLVEFGRSDDGRPCRGLAVGELVGIERRSIAHSPAGLSGAWRDGERDRRLDGAHERDGRAPERGITGATDRGEEVVHVLRDEGELFAPRRRAAEHQLHGVDRLVGGTAPERAGQQQEAYDDVAH